MENNKNMEFQELEEMREQMQVLRAKLDEQVKVNDEIMMKQLKKNAHSINTSGIWAIIGTIVVILLLMSRVRGYGISDACLWVTMIFALLEGGYYFYITHIVKEKDISQGNLTETFRHLVRIKKISRIGIIVDIASSFIIISWLLYEVFSDMFDSVNFFITIIIGLIIGYGIVIWDFKKLSVHIDEMIEMIDRK